MNMQTQFGLIEIQTQSDLFSRLCMLWRIRRETAVRLCADNRHSPACFLPSFMP